jgi:hypothetical protein
MNVTTDEKARLIELRDRLILAGGDLPQEGSATHHEATRAWPEIFPFPISIPERDLTDLRTRLDLTRLPEHETVPDATQGIELDRLKVFLDAWRQHDWRGLEERWNAIPHYRTHLDGLNIAFWHLRWPGRRSRCNR